MSDGTPARGIVVGHGSMAQGLVDAVRCIAGGAADALTAVSNTGMSPAQLRQRLQDLAGSDPIVVFADLHSGSCGMAAHASCRVGGDRTVICGVNLPMLLDFVFHRELPFRELVPRLIAKGKEGLVELSPGE